ncbi:MAG: pilus assembly protein [Burkholderiaceae bacterium]|nr:MAG: pilus assembly protein [Burkholderiaceae bacterium]
MDGDMGTVVVASDRRIDTEHTPAVRVLTAPGESHEVSAELREKLCFLESGELLVVTGSQMDQHVLAFRDDLRRRGVAYSVRVCPLNELRSLYAASPLPLGRPAATQEGERRESATQSKVVEIFAGAVREGASDIHFFDEEHETRIRIRVNGLLEDYAPLPAVPHKQGVELRAAIYQSMSDIADPTFKPHQPQDARMKESVVKPIGLYGARIATRPLDKGMMMVCRLLTQRKGGPLSLPALGYLPEQDALVSEMTENKQGIHIFAGATGSGKSTSLESLITRLIKNFHHQLNVLTLENPPEYKIVGARQTPVINDDWVGGIKNAMRLDPDVIMIGEMRDLSSAQSAFQAALTGHGVWTTLHANDPFGILQRLDDLQLDPGLYSDASLVRGLIYQCLVPIVCPHCSVPMAQDRGAHSAEFVRRVERACAENDADLSAVRLIHPQGCDRCRRGLAGRSVVAEVVSPTQRRLDVYRKQGKTAARQTWLREDGGISRAAHVKKLIASGRVDPVLAEALVCRLDYDDILLSDAT